MLARIVAAIIGLLLMIKIVRCYGDRQFRRGHEIGYKMGHEIGKSSGYSEGYRNGLNAKVKDAADELERFWKRVDEQTREDYGNKS